MFICGGIIDYCLPYSQCALNDVHRLGTAVVAAAVPQSDTIAFLALGFIGFRAKIMMILITPPLN